MKIIYSYSVSKIKYQLQYRTSSFFGALTQTIWAILLIKLYMSFYATNAEAFPIPFTTLVAYLWLQQAFFAMVSFWDWDFNIFESIKNGKVAYELLRPSSLYLLWFSTSFGNRISKIILRSPLILLAGFLLPKPYSLIFPLKFDVLILFLLSLFLGAILCTAMSMLIYLFSFFLLDSFGIRILFQSIGDFLMGAVIPLPFFPDAWQKIINLLPFASVCNTPYLIYSMENIDDVAISKITIQLVWITIILLVGKILENKTISKAVIQGG